jgi:nucleoside-diphosphate-sugar epimerase
MTTDAQHYLVTGAAGFIGSRVVELLLEEGHAVTAVDNLNDAYDVRLKRWRLDLLTGREGFHFHELDIEDLGATRRLFNTPYTAVINLAARAGVRQSVTNPWVYFQTNVLGVLNLLELCRESGTQKFVLSSTSSVYGDTAQVPFREDAATDAPLSPYAASKKSAEALAYTYHHLHGIDVSVLRYFTVYGPAGRPDMSLFRFVQRITEGRTITVYGDGRQSRDFTFVDDIARGTVAALRPLGFEVVNLGSDSPVTVNEAVSLVEELTEQTAKVNHEPMHPADVGATWADITKAGSLLEWRPETGLRDGVMRLIDWYRSNREWAREIETD